MRNRFSTVAKKPSQQPHLWLQTTSEAPLSQSHILDRGPQIVSFPLALASGWTGLEVRFARPFEASAGTTGPSRASEFPAGRNWGASVGCQPSRRPKWERASKKPNSASVSVREATSGDFWSLCVLVVKPLNTLCTSIRHGAGATASCEPGAIKLIARSAALTACFICPLSSAGMRLSPYILVAVQSCDDTVACKSVTGGQSRIGWMLFGTPNQKGSLPKRSNRLGQALAA